MSAKHTPGEWIRCELPESSDVAIGVEGLGRWVAVVPPSERQAADVALIAAASDLLEPIRLRHAYEALPADRGGNDGPKGMARKRWLDAEAAALAKAGAA